MKQTNFDFDTISKSDRFADISPHIVKRFWAYHQENPHVYQLFKKYANELKRAGRQHYGSGAIFERIRWHVSVETQGDDFKMNNNYRSCYSRLLVSEDESFDGFFRTRSRE